MLTEPWRIRLLGTFEVRSGNVCHVRCRTAKIEVVLAWLAWSIGKPIPRELIAAELWPDSEPGAASSNLRFALNSIRRQLEPAGVPRGSVVQNVGNRVMLNPQAATCDLVLFRRLLRKRPGMTPEERQKNLMMAIDLYRGELLPGHYEEIVERERQQVAVEFWDALQEVSRLLQKSGALEEQIQVARRLADENLDDEEAQARLLSLLAVAGRHEEVMARYEFLERQSLLRSEALPASVRSVIQQASPSTAPTGTGERVATIAPSRTEPPDDRQPARTEPPADAPPVPGPALEERRGEEPAALNIPMPLTRFFGRETEMERLDAFVRDPDLRLITVTGAGGTGKTRLVSEYARRVAREKRVNVAFVPAADLATGEQLPAEMARVLRMKPVAGQDLVEQVAHFLTGRPWLLILDNLEQIAAGAGPIVLQLLERAPALKVLATSRQALDILGEQEMPVEPLPVPEKPGSPEQMLEFPSVQLFLDRARRVAPDIQITPTNAADVARLCRELEGLPLSIELAAGWAAELTPRQMVARLAKKFQLLVGRRVGLPPRQASLMASLEWSYRLLPADLQRSFTMLGVFRGGFTLESLNAVCDFADALDVLAQLRSRSLVTVDRSGEETRFGMLEIVREFACEKLAPSDRAFLANRHARYFAELAEAAHPHLRGPDQAEHLDRLAADHANLHVALEWLLTEAPPTGVRMTDRLFFYWTIRGLWSDARQYLEKAVAVAEQQGDTRLLAEALANASAAVLEDGDVPHAREMAERSVALWRSLDDPHGLSRALGNLALIEQSAGEPSSAAALYQECASVAESCGDTFVTASALANASTLHLLDGRLDEAQACAERAVALHSKLGDIWGMATDRANLGTIACVREDAAAGWRHYVNSLAGFLQAGDLDRAAFVTEQLAALALFVDAAYEAAVLDAAARQLRLGVAYKGAVQDASDTERTCRERLGEELYSRACAQGRGLTGAGLADYVASLDLPLRPQ